MKMFKPVTTLSKNKASVGDVFLIDSVERTVVEVSKQTVFLSNKKEYPKQLFNNWMRISAGIDASKLAADLLKEKIKNMDNDRIVLDGLAKIAYEKRWVAPSRHLTNANTGALPYIVLTDGDNIRFYFAPTTKATTYDLEMSYKSLHGTKFYAFANGYYMSFENNVIIIGMESYNDKNLSDKRRWYSLKCLAMHMEEIGLPKPKFYKNIQEMFDVPIAKKENSKLLSSPSTEKKVDEETKHWTGLNGEIAQAMVEEAFDREHENDNDYPF